MPLHTPCLQAPRSFSSSSSPVECKPLELEDPNIVVTSRLSFEPNSAESTLLSTLDLQLCSGLPYALELPFGEHRGHRLPEPSDLVLVLLLRVPVREAAREQALLDARERLAQQHLARALLVHRELPRAQRGAQGLELAAPDLGGGHRKKETFVSSPSTSA